MAGGAVTHASIHTQTRLQAALTVEAVSAGLVTEQSRPPGLACALSFHWVTAETIKKGNTVNMMKVLQKYKKKGEKVPETVFRLKMYRSAKESFIHITKNLFDFGYLL